MLDEDVVVDAVAVVLPHDKDTTETVGQSLGKVLISGSEGERGTAGSPHRMAGAIHTLAEDLIRISYAAILPNECGSVGAIGNQTHVPLVPRAGTNGDGTIR